MPSAILVSQGTRHSMMSRLDHLKRFYASLAALEARLEGTRVLSECTGRMPWPKRGVYFFMEPGEVRTGSGKGARVVRVGTHALKPGAKSTLWKRLRQHRGAATGGGGNHRGSIFRRIVGAALVERHSLACETWDEHGGAAPREIREAEQPVEHHVSTKIGTMPFLWVRVDDCPGPESQRGFIERNAIALLSNHGTDSIDAPSPRWLGCHCNREKVRSSGLWNSNHVGEPYEPGFLDVLDELVHETSVKP